MVLTKLEVVCIQAEDSALVNAGSASLCFLNVASVCAKAVCAHVDFPQVAAEPL